MSNRVARMILAIIVSVPSLLMAADVRVLKGHQSLVAHLEFSPDSRVLASCGCDKTVKLWSVATGDVLKTLEGHQDFVWGLSFSPDGSRLASSGWDGTIRIWDVKDGRPIRELSLEGQLVISVAYAPDGKLLASATRLGELRLWNTETWTTLEPPMDIVTIFPTVAFDTKGRRLCGSSRFGIRTWKQDPESHKFFLEKTFQRLPHCLALRPDGKCVAVPKGRIEIWDIDKEMVTKMLEGHPDTMIRSLVYSSDGKRIVSGADDKLVKIWNVDDGREEATLTGHTDEVWAVAISPDGNHVASGGQDTTVRLWPLPAVHKSPE